MNMLESISSYNFVEIGGYAYFSNLFYNALFQVEIETGKTTFLGSFEEEKISDYNIHFEIIQQGKQIYFFPRLGRHLHIYDLCNKTMQMVEIRKESDPFFWIEEIVLCDDSILFIPKQRNQPVKKMEYGTYRLTNISNNMMFLGEYLSSCRNALPADIVEKYHIKYGEMVSCKQMPDGRWCCFKPVGRQMLRFVEGSNNLEILTLTVVNETELQGHIERVKERLFQSRTFFGEFDGFESRDFLEVIVLSGKAKENGYIEGNKYGVGKTIWEKEKGYL